MVLDLTGFQTVLLFASFPTAGALLGIALAEWVELDDRRLSYALHLAAGAVLGVVAVELVPQALDNLAPWWFLLAFFLGGLSFLGLDYGLGFVSELNQPGSAGTASWALAAGMGVDLFTDGLMIGAGFEVDNTLGLVLGLGLVVVDLPEGFTSTASLRDSGVGRGKRITLMVLLALSILVGASLGFWLLRDAAPIWPLLVLAWTAGALATLVVEEITPKAHHHGTERVATIYFLAGFVLYTAVATLVVI